MRLLQGLCWLSLRAVKCWAAAAFCLLVKPHFGFVVVIVWWFGVVWFLVWCLLAALTVSFLSRWLVLRVVSEGAGQL